MEHAGESGPQLSVAIEMKACCVQAAAASNQFFYKSRKEPRKETQRSPTWCGAIGKF